MCELPYGLDRGLVSRDTAIARGVLTAPVSYSKMLYMDSQSKVRVTFRVAPELADALRELPNQTLFVETALAAALGETCPVCDGRGRVPTRRLRISDFKERGLPPLKRHAALKLRQVVRLGNRLLATDLRLAAAQKAGDVSFQLARHDETLLSGRIAARGSSDLVFEN
jgi:hypothetical protein